MKVVCQKERRTDGTRKEKKGGETSWKQGERERTYLVRDCHSLPDLSKEEIELLCCYERATTSLLSGGHNLKVSPSIGHSYTCLDSNL